MLGPKLSTTHSYFGQTHEEGLSKHQQDVNTSKRLFKPTQPHKEYIIDEIPSESGQP